jgi:hypothetical protein
MFTEVTETSLIINPTPADIGVYTVYVRVLDTSGLEAASSFKMEIYNFAPAWLETPKAVSMMKFTNKSIPLL